jgi:DNA-directed RNA polymerase I subunit RPA2
MSRQNSKNEESIIVEQVALLYNGDKDNSRTKAWIKIRANRNPLVGDKFASRAGQKGILSQFWMDIDMPYCAMSGIRPDLLINPNAFPSRMTIGMLNETLVSKVGVLQGKFINSSPFQCNEKNDLYNPFGDILENLGFLRHGGETLISGVTGRELVVEILIGCVYYQRLRQMVSDKFQARSSGPIDQLTHQPVKGGRSGGGIRFGEMERDSLLAHGAAFILHDRLHASSDICSTNCCRLCGSIVSSWYKDSLSETSSNKMNLTIQRNWTDSMFYEYNGCVKCHSCNSTNGIDQITIPYVFKFLAEELAAMNIKLRLDIR